MKNVAMAAVESLGLIVSSGVVGLPAAQAATDVTQIYTAHHPSAIDVDDSGNVWMGDRDGDVAGCPKSLQRGDGDFASCSAYVGQVGKEGMALDAQDRLDSLFADSRWVLARLG